MRKKLFRFGKKTRGVLMVLCINVAGLANIVFVFLGYRLNFWMFGGELIVAFALAYFYVFRPTHLVKIALKQRGYEWITLRDAIAFRHEFGARFDLIIPHDEIACIPGYKEGSIQSVIEIVKYLDKVKA
ncbi:MAG: hypothetical protein ABI579_02770 [Candidatus Sumerlaeota bacterium]